jgi:uncharacterized protein (TIGR02687 family)
MDLNKVIEGLETKFNDHRIVFWQDTSSEFTEDLNSILEGISEVLMIEIDDHPPIKVKVQIELEIPSQKILIYSQKPVPSPKNDWYLDIRKYSAEFRADKSALVINELGLIAKSHAEEAELNRFADQYNTFFNSQERLNRFKSVIDSADKPEELELKLLALLLRCEPVTPQQIVISLYHQFTESFKTVDEIEWETLPSKWKEVQKYGVEHVFWNLVSKEFSYYEDTPSLKKFLCCLMVSDFEHALLAELPVNLKDYVLEDKKGQRNAVVVLSTWQDSQSASSSYQLLSEWVEKTLNIRNEIRNAKPTIDIKLLKSVKTFPFVDLYIASTLKRQIIEDKTIEQIGEFRSIIEEHIDARLDSYWASPRGQSPIQTHLHALFRALKESLEFLDLVSKIKLDSENNWKDLFNKYYHELYKIDQSYRKYYEWAIQVPKGWDILEKLSERIENFYINKYLYSLSANWNSLVTTGGVLDSWSMGLVPSQYSFHDRFIRPLLRGKVKRRIYVLISDAFRYESAYELFDQLNRTPKLKTEISPMLGVVPSYTALGMASLLPHKEITYNKDQVLVDGKSTSGILNRSKILESYNGIALDYQSALKLKKDEGREKFRDCELVYIYHNEIDATGDDAQSEQDTFPAVKRAINDLSELIRKIINSWNGSNILITTDHGFLFQQSSVDETDKSKLPDTPATADITKKRYIIGNNLGTSEQAISGKISMTAKVKGDTEFWVPWGTNRFHFSGGARFIHGGIMPQEIVIPVISVQASESKKVKKKGSPVTVEILGDTHRITTPTCQFSLLQTDAVSDKYLPMTLKIQIFDKKGEPISNHQTITFDSASKQLGDRQKQVRLTMSKQSEGVREGDLCLTREDDLKQVYKRISVTIDLAFYEDF